MPNWCYNTINNAHPKLIRAFKELKRRVDKGDRSQGINFKYVDKKLKTNCRYFFDICIEDNQIMFSTKWVPPEEEMKIISDNLNADFSMYSEECGMSIYYTFTRENGNFYGNDEEPPKFDEDDY